MGVEISELILEKCNGAQELSDRIEKYTPQLSDVEQHKLFYAIQPLLHQVINFTIEYMKAKEVK